MSNVPALFCEVSAILIFVGRFGGKEGINHHPFQIQDVCGPNPKRFKVLPTCLYLVQYLVG